MKTMKQCKKCKLFFPANNQYFWKGKAKSGLQANCIICEKQRNKDKYKPRESVYVKPDRQKCLICHTEKEYTDEYFGKRSRNRSRLSPYCKDCITKRNTLENDPVYKKEYYEANKEKEIARVKAWRKANSDKVTLARLQRSGFIHNSENFEQVDIDILIVRDKEVCQLCMKPVNIGLLWPERMSPSVDHIVPLSKGGEHNYANTQLAHLVCNMSKGNRV